MFTFLRPDGTSYQAQAPQNAQDIGVPEKPFGSSEKAYFDRDQWEWRDPIPSVEMARHTKLAEINAGYSTVMDYVQAGYPLDEVLSWERQAAQARELTQNPDAEALFVRTLAATKKITVEELCRRILANAVSWEPVAAMLTGCRQVMEEAAFSAETVEEIQAIKVSYPV